MPEHVDLGPEAQSLADRLRAVCLGRWQLDADRAEEALAAYLAALGVPSRPARWVEGEGGEGFATDGFLAAWAEGQFVGGDGIERGNDAFTARTEAEDAATAELKALDGAPRKQAEAAIAAAGRATRICSHWSSDVARSEALKAFSDAQQILSSGKRAGIWIDDKIGRFGLFGMMTPFTGAQSSRITVGVKQAAYAAASKRAAEAVRWAACSHVLHAERASCPAIDLAAEIYRPLVDAVEAAVWLFWVLDDEVVAVAARPRPREPGRQVATGEWVNVDPAIEQLYEEKLGAMDRTAHRDQMRAIMGFLPEEDWVVTLAAGRVHNKSGLFVLTNNRVLFLRGAFGIKQELELPYASVLSAVESGKGELTVTTPDEELVFKINEPSEVLSALVERMPEGGAELPPRPAEQLIQVPDEGGPHRETIARLFGELRRMDRWAIGERTIKVLPGYLRDEEELVALANVQLERTFGLVALTDSRLLFVSSKEPERQSASVELALQSVTSVAEAAAGKLEVSSGERELAFSVGKAAKRRELLEAIQARMPSAVPAS